MIGAASTASGIQRLDRESIQRVLRRTPSLRPDIVTRIIQRVRDLMVRRERSQREERTLENDRTTILHGVSFRTVKEEIVWHKLNR